MAKVELNYGPIENSCINSLDSVIGYLDEVIRHLQQNSIPGDFNRRTMLSNTITDLKSQRKSLINVKNWLMSSNSNYNSMIDKLNLQASRLPVYQVKRRTNKI